MRFQSKRSASNSTGHASPVDFALFVRLYNSLLSQDGSISFSFNFGIQS